MDRAVLVPRCQRPPIGGRLGKSDAPAARRALWALVASSRQSLPLLRERLKPAVMPAPGRVAQWLADLDDTNVRTRQLAETSLADVADLLAPRLRTALKETESAEVRRRLQTILEGLGPPLSLPAKLRNLRAIEALEHIGDKEARAILRDLAGGAPDALETRAARDTLDRLDKGVRDGH